MKGKGISKVLMLAMATGMITVMLIAGEPGTVKLSKDVYRTGEGQATVKVTDGTGGYKAGAGVGFNRVTAGFSGAGVHPIKISDEPSAALDDSGVQVAFPAPAAGEEALSVTAYCTVMGPKSLLDNFSYINFLESGKVGRVSVVIGPENWPGKLPILFTLVTADPKIACFKYNGTLSAFTKITKAGRSDFNVYKPSGNILAPDEKSKSCEISCPLSTHKATATVINAPPKVNLERGVVHTSTLLTRQGHVEDIEGATLLSDPSIALGARLKSSACIEVFPGGIIPIKKPTLESLTPVAPETFSYTIKYSSQLGIEYHGTSILTIEAIDPAGQRGQGSVAIKKIREFSY